MPCQLPLCVVRILIVRVSLGYQKLFYISFLEKNLQNTNMDFFFPLSQYIFCHGINIKKNILPLERIIIGC